MRKIPNIYIPIRIYIHTHIDILLQTNYLQVSFLAWHPSSKFSSSRHLWSQRHLILKCCSLLRIISPSWTFEMTSLADLITWCDPWEPMTWVFNFWFRFWSKKPAFSHHITVSLIESKQLTIILSYFLQFICYICV